MLYITDLISSISSLTLRNIFKPIGSFYLDSVYTWKLMSLVNGLFSENENDSELRSSELLRIRTLRLSSSLLRLQKTNFSDKVFMCELSLRNVEMRYTIL